MSAPLDSDDIARLIPHDGAMCLLEAVIDATESEIHCRADNHRRLDHPLREDGFLPAVAGIEYAAQAMAVHGGLLAVTSGGRPKQGMLVTVRGLTLHVTRLDDIAGHLDIHAVRLSGDETTVQYEFDVRSDGRILLEGRAVVLTDIRR